MKNEHERQGQSTSNRHPVPPVHWLAIGAGIAAAIFLYSFILSNFFWAGLVAVILIAFFWQGQEGVTFVRLTARRLVSCGDS